MSLVLDTSFVLGLIDADDHAHERCAAVADRTRRGGRCQAREAIRTHGPGGLHKRVAWLCWEEFESGRCWPIIASDNDDQPSPVPLLPFLVLRL